MFLLEEKEDRSVRNLSLVEKVKRHNTIMNHINKKIKQDNKNSNMRSYSRELARFDELGKKVKAKKASDEEIKEYEVLFNRIVNRYSLIGVLGFGVIGMAAGVGLAHHIHKPDTQAMRDSNVRMSSKKYSFEEAQALYESSMFFDDLF